MRAQQRKEFSHRGRLYRVLGYETGGRVLKRRDNGVWTVVVAPSYGLLQCMEQALGGQGAADRWRASPVVSFNQGQVPSNNGR